MNRFIVALFVTVLVTSNTNAQSFKCPNDKYGQYEDPVQCDKYYECNDGVVKTKICPDGLVFDPDLRKINKCDQPFNVDCGDRTELQPPKSPSPLCPRKNGFFAHPDPSICNIFYNCIDGDSIETVCTAGLYFDEYTGTCVWKENANREGCVDKSNILKDGFTCPKEHPSQDRTGQTVAHPNYAHPTDCQKFYVCLNGVEPRELGCQVGEVYNEELTRCDAPENVPGCEDWYATSEEKKN